MNRLVKGRAWYAVGCALLAVSQAQAAPVAYPFKGQSPQQQQRDDGECYIWAKNKTGVDPSAVANAPAPPSGPAVGGGERAVGAVRGAIIGGIVDGDHGARTGAAVGVVAGGMRARQKQQAQQASAQAQKQGALDAFNRAYSACMEGRGYTVR